MSEELSHNHGKAIVEVPQSSTRGDEKLPIDVVDVTEDDLGDLPCLTGDKPFFDVILMKSHVKPKYQLNVPVHMHDVFPKIDVTTVIKYHGKEWTMMYNGGGKKKQFERLGWSTFVKDNNLGEGDACIFEVMESTDLIVRIRAVILNNINHMPDELKNLGETFENAINLD